MMREAGCLHTSDHIDAVTSPAGCSHLPEMAINKPYGSVREIFFFKTYAFPCHHEASRKIIGDSYAFFKISTNFVVFLGGSIPVPPSINGHFWIFSRQFFKVRHLFPEQCLRVASQHVASAWTQACGTAMAVSVNSTVSLQVRNWLP